MARQVIVGFDWTKELGDCLVLEVHGTDETFLVPFDQAEGVIDAMGRILTEAQANPLADL